MPKSLDGMISSPHWAAKFALAKAAALDKQWPGK